MSNLRATSGGTFWPTETSIAQSESAEMQMMLEQVARLKGFGLGHCLSGIRWQHFVVTDGRASSLPAAPMVLFGKRWKWKISIRVPGARPHSRLQRNVPAGTRFGISTTSPPMQTSRSLPPRWVSVATGSTEYRSGYDHDGIYAAGRWPMIRIAAAWKHRYDLPGFDFRTQDPGHHQSAAIISSVVGTMMVRRTSNRLRGERGILERHWLDTEVRMS